MGLEARCRIRVDGRAGEGKALLETSELIFRGEPRLVIPFRDIRSLTDADGELRVVFDGGEAVFELGPRAAQWAAKIRNPRGRLDKLGVKPGAAVSLLGVADADFLAELRDRGCAFTEGSVAAGAGLVFYAAAALDDLARLRELGEQIDGKSAIWVVSPKGKGASIKDVEVMAAAREAGLVDTKVVAFSDTHTALKLVTPVANR